MVGIIGLILAIAAVIFLIWKNWHMAIVSLVGACDGAGSGLGALIATSSIMGFGAVVSASAAYQTITQALVNLRKH